MYIAQVHVCFSVSFRPAASVDLGVSATRLTQPDDSHGCSESMRGRGGDLKLDRWAVPASNACYGNCIEEKARQVTGGKNRQTTQIKSALVRIRGWNVLNVKIFTYTHIYLSDLFHRLQVAFSCVSLWVQVSSKISGSFLHLTRPVAPKYCPYSRREQGNLSWIDGKHLSFSKMKDSGKEQKKEGRTRISPDSVLTWSTSARLIRALPGPGPCQWSKSWD